LRYRAEIDGLRALAVVPVILFHMGFEIFSGGYVGVDVFFVISGFLITTIILREMGDGTFSITSFYERRARRILPALFFVIIVSTVFSFLILSPAQLQNYFDSVIATSTYWSNIYFWQNLNYFSGSADLQPLLHTWSLSIEEQYYVIYPFFLLLCWRLGKTSILVILVVVFIVSFGIAQWGSNNYPHANFYLLVTRGWELLVGAFVAFYLSKNSTVRETNLTAQIASLIGILLVMFSVFYFGRDTPFPSAYTLVPTIGTALIILFAIDGTLVNSLLRIRFLVIIGLASYSAYLWHQPILAFSRHLGISTTDVGTIFAVGTLIIALSFISYRYVETPFRNKLVVSSHMLWLASAGSVIAFIILSVATHSNDGFKGRYAASSQSFLGDIEASSEYIPKVFDSLRNIGFSEETPSRQKVILIGDSFTMDMANSLKSGGRLESINLAVHHISARCGNLYLDYSLYDEIDKDDRGRCDREGWYSDDAIRLMNEADDIWLVSHWQDWQLKYLEESLRNLRLDFTAEVTLFGTKKFWDDEGTFSGILEKYESGGITTLPTEPRTINSELGRISASTGTLFVDQLSLLCGESQICDLNTPESNSLISVDGGHLTKSGAARLADRLPGSLFR
jgi:peptidoglycan/LPS O-acetylase OafA/YrhL